MNRAARPSMLAQAAAMAPRATALIDDEGKLSYSELLNEVRTVAKSWPAGPEMVCVRAHADRMHLIGLLAVFESGRPLVPIHPAWSDARGEAACEELRVPLVHLDARRGILDRCPNSASMPAFLKRVGDDALMAVLFTSGSQARPKAVCLSRRAFDASALSSARRFPWAADERWLLSLPHAHIGGLSIITRCLRSAKAFVIPRDRGAGTLLETLARHRITRMSLVPTMLDEMVDLAGDAGPPSSLRMVLIGGAAIAEDLLERARRRKWPLVLSYGATETGSHLLATGDLTSENDSLPGAEPLPGVEVRTFDGEIQCRGPMLFEGYLETGRIIDVRDDHGWYSTGDAGRIDTAGRVHLGGRIDDMIITGGENVSPLRVEQVLRRCPGIRDALVFSRPDARWGEVVAALIRARAADAETSSLAAEIRRSDLAPFERPRLIALVDEIPTNASGKPDRKAARACDPRDLTFIK